ncbi:hypothetical protein MKZ38_002739 [Zalerion maritima]|uniref:MI domain-containing protein n=1 Tax=Zalerion maritima TaxID=339359 RepID=A0AAD5WQM5_9PEZI|nr:hypothetical protein MKZ38_002739 [Zalerion maritima]
MSTKLSNGFLRHLGLEGPADGNSADRGGGNPRKRKQPVPQGRKAQRQAERDTKRSRQRGSFQSQQGSRPNGGSSTSRNTPQTEQNGRIKGFKDRTECQRPRGPPRDGPAFEPDDNQRSRPKPKPKPKSKSSSNDLPWSDDDSVYSSDFDSEPEQPVPKKSQKSAKEIEKEKKLPKVARERLHADEKEIARLERKLGIKKDRKSLPKAFKDDGLADLMGDLGGEGSDDEGGSGLGSEDGQWLRQKRKKALASQRTVEEVDEEGVEDEDEDEGDDDSMDFDEDIEEDGSGDDDGDEFEAFDSEPEIESEEEQLVEKTRENPYLPPPTGRVATEDAPEAGKYVPPHLRHKVGGDDNSQLQKKIKSTVNKVTQATIIPCLRDIDRIYRSNARQVVTETVVNQLLQATSERAQLVDAFTVDIAGFSAAVFKIAGTDFVAHLVQRSYEMFGEYYQDSKVTTELAEGEEAVRNKETNNLISLISALYSLDVVGARLVYDYIRFLLNPENFTERNTHLLMRIIQVCGPKLRKDDPASLKAVSKMVKPAVAKLGSSHMNFRTKFMIDNINDLVNNKPKAVKRYAISSERITSMKKTLGSVKLAGAKSTEPLNLGFEDMEKAGTKGMWWRVGARWDGNRKDSKKHDGLGIEEEDSEDKPVASYDSDSDSEPDLIEAAQAQGMNTELRRSIFAALMTGLDVEDGFRRISTLRLNANKQKEIPSVLVQCAGSEKEYNMYYALLARRFCVGHQMQYAFQAALWQVFRRLGEGLFDEAPDHDMDGEDEEEFGSERDWNDTRIANTARLFGVLISEGLLPLRSLRSIDILRTGNRAKEFLTLVMVTIMIPVEEKSGRIYRKLKKGPKSGEGAEAVERVFAKVRRNESPVLVAGILDLIKRARQFKGLGKKDEKVLQWAAGIAKQALTKVE